jgi:hypothetical protein
MPVLLILEIRVMETGTQIILQRMKDCPEEFAVDPNMGISRWERIIGDARDYLPKEDIEALDAGYKQTRIDLYNERVLRTLAGEDTPRVKMKVAERYATGMTDARGLFGGVVAKQEGAMVQNTITTGSSYPYEVNPAQNALAGGWWTK